MKNIFGRVFRPLRSFLVVGFFGSCLFASSAAAIEFLDADKLEVGDKGYGLTIMGGPKIEKFGAEVLGLLKNASPGRDLILMRLSGENVARTRIAQGMSGSPVYIGGKLIGAVAYAWEFGSEPIAGVTPIHDMVNLADPVGHRPVDLQRVTSSNRLSMLARDVASESESPPSVEPIIATLPPSADDATGRAREIRLRPVTTPLAVSGLSSSALDTLSKAFANTGIVPVAGGQASAKLRAGAIPDLVPGGALGISLMTGDIDMTAMGTVTHVEGDRVYGFGHPMMELGDCELPMMVGFIHVTYPSNRVSFKLGSALSMVGTIDRDVSTAVAGTIGPTPKMVPVEISVRLGRRGQRKTFHSHVIPSLTMMPGLLLSAMIGTVEMEGRVPRSSTATVKVQFDIKGHDPLIVADRYSDPRISGTGDGEGAGILFDDALSSLNTVLRNQFEPLEVTKVTSSVEIVDGRTTAFMTDAELSTVVYEPGETVRGRVFLDRFQHAPVEETFALPLPPTIRPGNYELELMTDILATEKDVKDNPVLAEPRSFKDMLTTARTLMASKNSVLVARVSFGETGVVVANQALPDLPASVMSTFKKQPRRAATTKPVKSSIASRKETPWVLGGMKTLKFSVVRQKQGL